MAFHCDLNKSDQIATLFSTIQEQFGGVDVCVNNAGLFFAGSLLNGDVEQWRTVLNVNVLAAAHCAQLAIRSMRDRNTDEGQVRDRPARWAQPQSRRHGGTDTRADVTDLCLRWLTPPPAVSGDQHLQPLRPPGGAQPRQPLLRGLQVRADGADRGTAPGARRRAAHQNTRGRT